MGICSATKVTFLLLIFGLVVPSLAIPYEVIWSNQVSPSTALQGFTLHAGDTLNFVNAQMLPIYLVDKATYDGCLRPNVDQMIGLNAVVTYTLATTGTYYFVGPVVYCPTGLKLAAQVS